MRRAERSTISCLPIECGRPGEEALDGLGGGVRIGGQDPAP
jgi:hypothetical protein